jgi:hypothetical protein
VSLQGIREPGVRSRCEPEEEKPIWFPSPTAATLSRDTQNNDLPLADPAWDFCSPEPVPSTQSGLPSPGAATEPGLPSPVAVTEPEEQEVDLPEPVPCVTLT